MRTTLIKTGRGERISPEALKNITPESKAEYREFLRYYAGDPIELKNIWDQNESQGVSPNNFAPSGYPGYMIDIMAGYIGSPGKIIYTSKEIKEKNDIINRANQEIIDMVNRANHEKTLTPQQIKQAGIYGESAELHFIQKTDKGIIPRFVNIDPSNVYQFYSEDVSRDLLAVAWYKGKSLTIYYQDIIEEYTKDETGVWIFQSEKKNDYSVIPWVITQNNEQKSPTWYCVKRYVDIIDALQTGTLNALDRHARGTLLTSMPDSLELRKNLRNLNAVFGMSKGGEGENKDFWEYVDQNLDPDLREVMLTHFINELHKISGVFDFTKLDLGQDPSGTALKYRIYPMELKAAEMASYRELGLQKRYEIIGALADQINLFNKNIPGDVFRNVKIEMQRNIPDNVKAILEENMLMSGDTDTRTRLERIPGIDPDEVIKRMDGENPDLDEV